MLDVDFEFLAFALASASLLALASASLLALASASILALASDSYCTCWYLSLLSVCSFASIASVMSDSFSLPSSASFSLVSILRLVSS